MQGSEWYTGHVEGRPTQRRVRKGFQLINQSINRVRHARGGEQGIPPAAVRPSGSSLISASSCWRRRHASSRRRSLSKYATRCSSVRLRQMDRFRYSDPFCSHATHNQPTTGSLRGRGASREQPCLYYTDWAPQVRGIEYQEGGGERRRRTWHRHAPQTTYSTRYRA